MHEILYGRNAVREALRAGRRQVQRLLLADNIKTGAPVIKELLDLAQQANIPVQQTSRKELDKVGRGHQGVALAVGAYPTVDLAFILAQAARAGEAPFLLLLDHLEDPQNVGAILRTAEVVGVHGVIIPGQRAASITPAVVNASAGASEHLAVAQVANLTQTIKLLKQENIWVAGLEYQPQAELYHTTNLGGPLALVLGSEGGGLSRLVAESCDFLVKLPMRGRIESLNASVAAALLLYEVWRTRGF